MKPLKKTCILILIVALFTAILPVTALAGVTGEEPWYGETAAIVYSSLTNLTSTRPQAVYAWSSTPTVPFTATLSGESGYSLPSSITVQRVKYYDITTQEPIVPATVDKIYASGTDYTYNASNGEIVIPVATLGDIVYDQSPYHIQIVASGVANPTTYTITVTQSANGTISPASADNISQGSDLTFTITPDSGFQIADVLVDGASVGTVSSYSFTNIISNHSITATFEETSATPSPSATPFPSATPSPSATPFPSETPPPSDDPLDDIPKTGDNSLSWVWWVLCSISLSGIATLIVIRKKASLNR